MTKEKILIFFDSKEKKSNQNLILFLKNIDYKKNNVDLIIAEDNSLKMQIPKKVNIQEIKNHKNKILNIFQVMLFKIRIRLKKQKYAKGILFSINSNLGNYIIRKNSIYKQLFIYDKINQKELEYREYFFKKNIYDFNNIVFRTYEDEKKFLKYFPTLSKKTSVINLLFDSNEIEKLSKIKINEKINKTDQTMLLIEELNEEKNQTLQKLKLIKNLISKFPKLKLYIIGDGLDKYAYQTYIEDNKLEKYIYLIGEKENVYPYIEKCKYLFLNDREQIERYIYAAITLNTQVISKCRYSDDKTELGNNYGYIISSNQKKQLEEIINILNNK